MLNTKIITVDNKNCMRQHAVFYAHSTNMTQIKDHPPTQCYWCYIFCTDCTFHTACTWHCFYAHHCPLHPIHRLQILLGCASCSKIFKLLLILCTSHTKYTMYNMHIVHFEQCSLHILDDIPFALVSLQSTCSLTMHCTTKAHLEQYRLQPCLPPLKLIEQIIEDGGWVHP